MNKKRLTVSALIVAMGILVAVGIYAAFQPRFKPGKVYHFRYTFKSSLSFKGVAGFPLPGRTFLLVDGGTFSTPLTGLRGERIAVRDGSLPEDSFKIVERESPELRAGSFFQEKYQYHEVRYNFSNIEPQGLVPQLTLKN